MDGVPAGTVTISDALASAPWYRREPYLLFFPLGVLLSWAGVAHWLAFSLGLLGDFQPIFHAMTQVQGFLMCFAVGFLMTMVPRRTGSAPPAAWEVAVCAIAPVVTSVAAWNQAWHVSQAAWLALASTLVAFAVRRFLAASSRRRPPNGFVWIPASIGIGIVGAVLTGIGAAGPGAPFWLHDVGQGMVLQGMFVGLVLGVGGLAFPLMTRGQAPADAQGGAADWSERILHLAAASVLVASFVVQETVSVRTAMLLRAAVVVSVLVFSVELWRRPDQPGANRWLVWAAGWCLPLGYLVAAAWPQYPSAGLHVVFIGCFATLSLAVGTQVTLGHGGYREIMLGRPWQVTGIAALMILALLARVLMEADRAHYFFWMGLASAAFLAAGGLWMVFLVPKMAVARQETASPMPARS